MFFVLVASVVFASDEGTIAAGIDSLEAVKDNLKQELAVVEADLAELRLELARVRALGDSIAPVPVRTLRDGKLRAEPYVYGEVYQVIPEFTPILVTAYAGDEYWEVLAGSDAGYMSGLLFSKTPETERMIRKFEAAGSLSYSDQKKAKRAEAQRQANVRARADFEALVASTAPEGSRVVTLRAYSKLKTGMNYTEASATIGCWGTEISRSDLAGYTTVMYSWQNPNGSNMNVMFQNGRLVSKAQFGLE